ncbi:MAG: PAS domain S-box protein [Pseudomonadota bacterium]
MGQNTFFNQQNAETLSIEDRCAHYAQILDHTPDMIAIHNRQGICLDVTPACYHLTGYSPNELIGETIYSFIHPADLEIVQTSHKSVLYQKNCACAAYRLRHKDGSYKWMETISKTITSPSKDPIERIMATTRDITQRKTLEKELRDTCKMQSIQTLAGGIAHHFNNLLYIILGNAELAMETLPKENKAHKNIQAVQSAGLRAAEVVKQLLAFNRFNHIARNPMDLVALIKDSLNELKAQAPTNITIQSQFHTRNAMILADKIQIQQAFNHLYTNACQSMADMNGLLIVKVETITSPCTQTSESIILPIGDYLKITIQDNGQGIDSKIMDQIFDPYFTTRDVGQNSGMGLTLARCSIEKHGGEIMVHSETGKGCTVTIFLPQLVEQPETIQTIPSLHTLPKGDETILFVDDEISIVEMNKEVLTSLGYTVKTAIDPVDALTLFKTSPHEFDMVISDMLMPGMTGMDLLEHVKKIRPDIPFIFCTGNDSPMDKQAAIISGSDNYLVKPISISDIARHIRKILDESGDIRIKTSSQG